MSQSGRKAKRASRPELTALEGRCLLTGNPLVASPFNSASASVVNLHGSTTTHPFLIANTATETASSVALARAAGGGTTGIAAFGRSSVVPVSASTNRGIFLIASPARSSSAASALSRIDPQAFGATTPPTATVSASPRIVLASTTTGGKSTNPNIQPLSEQATDTGSGLRIVGGITGRRQFGIPAKIV